MKRIGCLIVIILLFSIELFGQSGYSYVKPKKENVRTAPNGDKIGEVLGGTQVKVLEKIPNWVKVQFTGWIWEKSLTSDFTTVDGYKVRASHILVKTEEEAKRILEQIRKGGDFAELASKHSIDQASGAKGGELGQFGRGDLVPEFEKAVFNLKLGEVSGVIKTGLGYHIIKRVG